MRIRVINVKNMSKYCSKVIILIAVVFMFSKLVNNSKYFDANFKTNSSSLLNGIDKKNIFFNNKNYFNNRNNNGNSFNYKYFNSSKFIFSKEIINSELGLAKMVASQNNAVLEDNTNSNNTEKDEDENSKIGQFEEKDEDENSKISQFEEKDNEENIEILPSNVPDRYTYELFGVKVRSECKYNLQNEITDLNVNFNKNDVLIFHTHTCESYTQTEQYSYNATGNYRTTDLNYSVCRVGDELEGILKKYGYNVIHNKSYHDYPSYTGSYNRSMETVKNLLSNYSGTDIVIDLHRDAIGDNTYAPTVKIGEDYCARIMFVIGTDGGGLSHSNWRENVKIALKLQAKADELYPGLFKPMIVRNSRYNHNLAKGACIIEVGATGNTLEQCLNSMKYLGKIYNEF